MVDRRHADGARPALEVEAVRRRPHAFAPVVPVEAAAVAVAGVVVRRPGLARGEREPGRRRCAAAQRYTPAQAAAGATDEGHQRRRVYRARPEAAGHPGPAVADLGPAAVVRGGKTPGRVVHPGPAPGLDPGPAAVAVGRPVGRGDAGVPDGAVGGVLRPFTPGVELGVAGQLARQVLGRARTVFQRVARGGPLVERIAQRRRRLGDEQIAPAVAHLLVRADPGRLSGAAVHGGAAGMHRQARGVAMRVDVQPVFARLVGHQRQLRGVDLDALTRLQLAHTQRQAAGGERQLDGVVVEPGDAQVGTLGQTHGAPAAVQLGARAGVEDETGAGAHRPVQAGALQQAAVAGDLRRAFQCAEVGHAVRRVGLRPAEQRCQQQQRAGAPAAPAGVKGVQCHGLHRAGAGSLGCTGSDSTRRHGGRFAAPCVGRAKSGVPFASKCDDRPSRGALPGPWFVRRIGRWRLPGERQQLLFQEFAPLRAALTAALAAAMSALPASRALTAPMTLPMSPGPWAPSSATMARTSAAMSLADRRAGR